MTHKVSPQARALLKAHKSRSVMVRAADAHSRAQRAYWADLAACKRSGVTFGELARQFNTSAARVREQIMSIEQVNE